MVLFRRMYTPDRGATWPRIAVRRTAPKIFDGRPPLLRGKEGRNKESLTTSPPIVCVLFAERVCVVVWSFTLAVCGLRGSVLARSRTL